MSRKWYSLIDKVYSKTNLEKAFKTVKSNKGAPGVDGETVDDFAANLNTNITKLHEELKTDTYEAQPVRRVYIDRPDGSKRPLGIPTVRDRVVQQELRNVMEPIFEPEFHPSSYGYRPTRSCHKAVAKAERFMNKYGLRYVVDMDLSKCFDTLDHELIFNLVNKKISDGKVLKLVRKFLKSGVMEDGQIQTAEIGSPQGGVISPLLMNIYLNEFDQEMKGKGIRIVRYADDILILARSRREAGKYRRIATQILEQELKLKVNQEKTSITSIYEGVAYLGFTIYLNNVIIHPERIQKFKDRVREITKSTQGRNLEGVIQKLNSVIRGWSNYFGIANCKRIFKELMAWIRRRLRMKKMKEWKSWKALHKQLRRNGYKGEFEKIRMNSWRNSGCTLVHMALPNKWFDKVGPYDLSKTKVGILYGYYEI